MQKNPDSLMDLKPAELKSLDDGEFRIYSGLKFEALEKSYSELSSRYSKLDKRMFYLMLGVLSTLATAVISLVC